LFQSSAISPLRRGLHLKEMQVLTVIVVFTIASVVLELLVVRHLPLVANLARRYRLVSVVLSVSLSWLLGHVFAATGTIVMISAVVSSAVTQPLYDLWNRMTSILDAFRQQGLRATLLVRRFFTGLSTLRAHFRSRL
jgi:hypothetical protein